jgi:hypothetical protein
MTVSNLAEPYAGVLKSKRSYVLLDQQILYVSLAKNACTSLKWLMAELAGEDPASFRPGLGSSTTLEDGIHNRSRWRKVPRLVGVDPETRRAMRPDNGWFIFAVVRDPRVRLFSAWENKFLLRNPKYAVYRDEPWFPRIPRTTEDVVADFAAFVAMLEADPAHELHRDSHFSSQTRLLTEQWVPYTRIYEISELTQLVADLEAHLESTGSPRSIRLRRSNDTPLAANAAVFANGVREQVEHIYAADFERFPDLWDFARVESRPAWSADAFRHAQAIIDHDERISELRALAQRAVRRNRRLAGRVGALEARIKELEGAGTGPQRGPLKSMLRRRS